MTKGKTLDVVLCGSCVLDLLVRPFDLDHPVGHGAFHPVEPVLPVPGGITANAGITLSRLGKQVAIISRLGSDAWAGMLRGLLEAEGIDTERIGAHPTHHTSATVALIDPTGERSFFHSGGAHRTMTVADYLAHLELFAQATAMLWGYFPMAEGAMADLPRMFEQIREAGCMTAMDAAGDGGAMADLERVLPHLDVYVPSRVEASGQTGETDPERMIARLRAGGAKGIVGVKLGNEGALLSGKPGALVHVPACDPPGAVVDATGAGDCFYAGLIAGLLDGLDLADAGRLACAAGACCVTSLGGSTGGRDMAFTRELAGGR